MTKYQYSAIIGCFLVAFCAEIVHGESTLKAVAMLTRHGDRSPDAGYPLNPYSNFKWPGGFGALSPKGVRELYYSGMIKSRRYANLFAPSCSFCSFDIKKVYAQSSAYELCIESGKSFLAGFLPVSYPDSLIRVIPKYEDEMLGLGKSCPKFGSAAMTWTHLNDTAYREIIDIHSEEGKHFIEYMENSTGLTSDNLFASMEVTLIQLDNGLKMPEWAESIFDKLLVPLMDLGINIISASAYSHIRNGVLIKDIMERFLNFLSGSSEQNILFYSGHDVNIAGMLYHLDMHDQMPERPAYGAMFNLEIYDNPAISDDYEVKVVYFRKFGDENPMVLDIPNCKAPCPFGQYLKLVQPKYTLDFDKACNE